MEHKVQAPPTATVADAPRPRATWANWIGIGVHGLLWLLTLAGAAAGPGLPGEQGRRRRDGAPKTERFSDTAAIAATRRAGTHWTRRAPYVQCAAQLNRGGSPL